MSRHLFTSESVSEGHPDKICDQISDTILDACLEQDPMSRVACETAVTTGLVLVCGEITTKAVFDVPHLVRNCIKEIGYTHGDMKFEAEGCGVIVAIGKQSPDISQGVGQALEHRSGDEEDELNSQGAGDQGLMFGFACDETPELMPLPIALAHQLMRQQAKVRKEGILPYLRPDAKSQVSVVYENGKPVRIDTLLVSTQHTDDVDQETIKQGLLEHVVKTVVAEGLMDKDTRYLVNPTGRFVIGGPHGDAGLTGRKIIVDTYGGYARHGGGAFSGKDPSKVDRSAAYAARWVAKHLVAAGAASKVEIQVSYAIGVARPTSVLVETFGTHKVSPEKIQSCVDEVFDLRPAAILRDLNLRRPIYTPTAAYGHFGREEFPWEQLTKLADAKRALGL